MAEFPKCQTKLKFQSMSYIHVFKISMTMSRKIKTGGSNEKKKIKVTKKKQENLFLVFWIYTDCDFVLSSSRDFPRLKLLQFDFW